MRLNGASVAAVGERETKLPPPFAWLCTLWGLYRPWPPSGSWSSSSSGIVIVTGGSCLYFAAICALRSDCSRYARPHHLRRARRRARKALPRGGSTAATCVCRCCANGARRGRHRERQRLVRERTGHLNRLGVRLGQGGRGELPRRAANGAKQRPLGIEPERLDYHQLN